MTAPPLATGLPYPVTARGEERTNYLAGSVAADTAYIDNVLPIATTTPISDTMISVLPSLTFNRKTPRQQETFTYTPAITYYRQSSGLNTIDQSATGTFQGRLSPNITLGLQEYLMRTSNVFNTRYPFTAGGISGAAQTPVPALIVPFAEQMRNTADADLTYQFSSKGMIGGGGQFLSYRYPNHAQTPGLYDSDGTGGSAFYNRRLSRAQYAGVIYEYNNILSYTAPSHIQTQVNEVLPFYTLNPERGLSLSVSAGMQHVLIAQKPQTYFDSWLPVAALSLGWQGERGGLAASYLHTAIAGEGFLGAFTSDNVNLSGSWKFASTWNGTTAFGYETVNSAAAIPGQNFQGGHTIVATAALEHTMGNHFSISIGYDHLHEQYNGLAVISANPDSNREHVVVSYKFTRPMGR